MFAAGLLGLGAVSVVVAVVFLLGVFFWEASVTSPVSPENPPVVAGQQSTPAQAEAIAQAEAKSLEKSKDALGTLCMWLRPGVAVLVILLLWVTARSYLSSIFDDSPPHWTTSVLTGMVVVDYLVIALFIAVYMWVGSAGPSQPSEGAGGLRSVARGVIKLVWMTLQPDQDGETKTLNIAIFTALGYSLVSAFLVGLVVFGSATFWNSSSTWVDFAFVATAFWVMIVALIPLGALLAPTFGPRRAAARSHSAI
jgi:CubicO group peptidase (beta-lactamase class C family)